jgi:hypothetical protein
VNELANIESQIRAMVADAGRIGVGDVAGSFAYLDNILYATQAVVLDRARW